MLLTNEWYQAGNEIVFLGHMGMKDKVILIPVNPTVLETTPPSGPTQADMLAAERELNAIFGEDVVILHNVEEASTEVLACLMMEMNLKSHARITMTPEHAKVMEELVKRMGSVVDLLKLEEIRNSNLCPEILSTDERQPFPKKPHLRLV